MRIPIDSLPLQDVVMLPSGVPDTSAERATAVNAQFLWRAAHAHAQRKGHPKVHETVPGRELTINMAKVLEEAFLGLSKNQESLDARKNLYDFLRDTRNMKCTQSLGPATGGIWWVADEWNAARRGRPAPAEGALTGFGERRLRPQDAGEHRDPQPVIGGFRCLEPGCPDTQTFPHSGALEEHRKQAHPTVVPDAAGLEIDAIITATFLAEDDEPGDSEQESERENTGSTGIPALPEFSQESLAKRLFDIVQDSGMTQKQVGDALGLHSSSISSMITGRQRVSVEQVFRLSQILGVSVQELLGLPAAAVQVLAPAPREVPLVVLPAHRDMPTSELVSLLASRVEEAEADIRALRAAASDGDRDELVAELREENQMHLRTIEQMRADVHRARKLMGRE